VDSFAGSSVTLAGVFKVLGLAPKPAKAPAPSGTPQVNHAMTVSKGTWSPTCTSYGFQSYSGGVAVAGATKVCLLLTSARAKESLYAAVTCARTEYVSGARSATRSPSAPDAAGLIQQRSSCGAGAGDNLRSVT
jgi:hypothetical protein